MSFDMTQAEVMRLARLSGEMVAAVHGRPELVIGVARSGTALASEFAHGANARDTVRFHLQRASSAGAGGQARSAWSRIAPAGIRRAYKEALFPTVARLSHRVAPARPLSALDAQVLDAAVLDAAARSRAQGGRGVVALVDDTIDTGQTLSRLLGRLERTAPELTPVVVAMGSTIGRRVSDVQYTVSHGEIVDFVDGDLSRLDDPTLLGGPLCECPPPAMDVGSQRLLYLDLDGTLTSDSFRDAAEVMSTLLRSWGEADALGRFAALRSAKKVRAIDHHRLKLALDTQIRALEPDRNDEFQRVLAGRLECHARTGLESILRARGVTSAIVTAALRSYAPAVETAFGVPVLCGSGPTGTGEWAEVNSDDKVAAITAHRCARPGRTALLIGDTGLDGRSVGSGVSVVCIPRWDTTGLLTLLGQPEWWGPQR